MKKYVVLFLVGLLTPINIVFADGLIINYKEVNGKYELEFAEDDKKLSYDEANNKYDLGIYFEFLIDGSTYYFLNGKEITEEEYISGKKDEDLRKVCKDKDVVCIDINSQEELLSKIDEIYSSEEIKKYHLMYSDSVYQKIDFNEVRNRFKDKYMVDMKKNAYKYAEYGLRQPLKIFPDYNENEMIISNYGIKTTLEEEKLVDEFLDSFLKEFKGKSDYEKVLGVYNYLRKTSSYKSDDGYEKFIDGKLSPYDVLLTHQTVCIGSSTTFQFLMEKLGVESFIIDHVADHNEETYATTHTYNVVKLDNSWFIVDINFSEKDTYFLTNDVSKYDAKDLEYLGITINDKSYYDIHPEAPKTFDMDYEKYVKLADDIIEHKDLKKEDEKNANEGFNFKYILVLVIIIVIGTLGFFLWKRGR